jgi:5-(carboxyamino)imidazole ribonucleotide synthase
VTELLDRDNRTSSTLNVTHCLLPGATIGIVGGGQLGRMMALAARRMGYRVAVLDPDPSGPAGQVADIAIGARFDDAEAALRLARQCQVVTLDLEHVPASVIGEVERICPVRPSSSVMATVQDRLAQRQFLARYGLPQVRFAPVDAPSDLPNAVRTVGFPCVLKTRTQGYDGKGQARATVPGELEEAFATIGARPAVMEEWVDFQREVSVLLARATSGEIVFYPIPENLHRRHILFLSRAPAALPDSTVRKAQEIGAAIAEHLGHVGVLAVELFVTDDGQLLVNEIAPRTHNSGHYTFGASATSQFEQHLRAVCGLPLGDTRLLSPAAMLNLLGDLWAAGEPDWSVVFRYPEARLHLYGKKRASPGRKMGHVLVLHPEVERAVGIASEIATALEEGVGLSSLTRYDGE